MKKPDLHPGTITAVDLPKMPSEVGVMTSIAQYSKGKTQRYFSVAVILIREKRSLSWKMIVSIIFHGSSQITRYKEPRNNFFIEYILIL